MKRFSEYKIKFIESLILCFMLMLGIRFTSFADTKTFSSEIVDTQKTKDKVMITNGNENIKIHYIDVGQGDSALVQQDGYTMLIDAGPNSAENILVNYIRGLGIKRLDYVIGTHPHEDHIGGLDKVIDNFEIGTLLMPKKIANTKTFKDVLLAAKHKGLNITQPIIGTNYNLGKATFRILAPKDHAYKSTNNYSIVQKLRFGNRSFIFTGDAEKFSESEILQLGYDIKADVLKVGHHGSKTSSTNSFLDKVNPKYAVISCEKGNCYGHPHKVIMDKLKSRNIKVYRTDECGTIIATSNGEDISFNCKEGTYNNGQTNP
ncbi:ComEC/Rec2 family competence protein [Clostridium novyi]|uniref:Metallo beta-lactamase superfamily hydrolase n=1 Tax=Clostridium novyi (strain NT) TaxID=386415 RepID=A0Q250_CLONN|nr:ComEC/Rec2 family competence protein [Clostridium novyi]ABK61322.1 Metallo beta-lactamase superfamily hydrolase [Clostridium novyi NT]KEH86220.1 competence protein ComE [Clostridium novyi A str. NCTC 538]